MVVFFVVTGMRVFVVNIEWRGVCLCSSASWFLFCVFLCFSAFENHFLLEILIFGLIFGLFWVFLRSRIRVLYHSYFASKLRNVNGLIRRI